MVKNMGLSDAKRPSIIWFRQDLRLADNPALHAACEAGEIIPVYILDTANPGDWAMGGASRWWLHQALESLNQSLQGRLNIFQGDPLEILNRLVEQTSAGAIFWNRCYEPWRIQRDGKIKTSLKEASVDVRSFNGSLLWEPWEVLKNDGTPYKVFTPYYRRGCLSKIAPRKPLAIPNNIQIQDRRNDSLSIAALSLLPNINWHSEMDARWDITETAAQNRLDEFVIDELEDYRDGRNFPAKPNVSRLSAYLHFGQISVNTVWHQACDAAALVKNEASIDTFLSELGWREFSH